MSEANQPEQDRWRELHELLGLPEDNTAAKPASPPPSPPPAEPLLHKEHAAYIAAESPLPDDEVDVELPPPALEAGMEGDEDRALPAPEEEEIPEALDEEETLPDPEAPREPARDERDRPRRGRRRGRRGRRSHHDADEARSAQPLDTDDTEVEPSDEQGAAPARRTPETGEGASDDDFGDDSAVEEEVPLSSPQPAAENDDDDEPVETFADWNVPSWQEIVASLYRPER